MNNRIPFAACLPSLWLFACGANIDGTSESSKGVVTQSELLRQQVASATLTLKEATDIAQAAHPGSTLLEADLDGRAASPRFEVELLVNSEVIEVHVDAQTGDIIDTFAEDSEHDDDGDKMPTCDLVVSVEEATAIAEAQVGGTAVEVEIDDCRFEIVVDTGTALIEVDVAGDGAVQGMGTEDRDDDDDRDGDDDDDDRDGDDDDRDGDDDDRDGDGDDDDDDDDDRDEVAVDCTTAITSEEASVIAAAAAGGTVNRVEADDDDCDFEVDVQVGTDLVEVDVAADGTVTKLKTDNDDKDDKVAIDCTTAITSEEASVIAATAAGGTVVRVEADDDDCDFEVDVQVGTDLVEVDVAADGTVVKLKVDD